MIRFTKEDHRYASDKGEFTSVSKLIGKYKNDFDKDHWSTYKALEELIPDFKIVKKGWVIESPEFIAHASSLVDSAELLATTQRIQEEWRLKNDASIRKGNAYHSRKEESSYRNGVETNPFTGEEFIVKGALSTDEDKHSIITNLYDLDDGYYPELLLWNEDKLLAGQADKVFITSKNDVRYIDIDDFKTNSKIKQAGYKGQKMKAPLSHLQDCNYSHYNLQISLYAWMMEQFGFYVRNLSFHHFNQMYKLSYLKKEVESIL